MCCLSMRKKLFLMTTQCVTKSQEWVCMYNTNVFRDKYFGPSPGASQLQSHPSLLCSVILQLGLCKTTSFLASWLSYQYGPLEGGWQVGKEGRDLFLGLCWLGHRVAQKQLFSPGHGGCFQSLTLFDTLAELADPSEVLAAPGWCSALKDLGSNSEAPFQKSKFR